MSEKLTITTRFSPELIEQTLDLGTDDLVASKTRQVIQLQDQGIRDALAAIGWLAPNAAAALRQQLDAKEEECRQRIKADRLYCMRHGGEAAQELAAENAELNQQLDQAQADVARLRERLCKTCEGVGMIGGPSPFAPDEGGEHCPECSAFIKLKQAEAIEYAAERIRSAAATNADIAVVYEGLLCEAQRLRGEVDDA